jgi:hypothetical protein
MFLRNWQQWLTGSFQRPRRAGKPKERKRRTTLLLEPLERRLVPSIVWVNRDTDTTFQVYGDKAPQARAIVDAAIAEWNQVIVNFNYRIFGLPNFPRNNNEFDLTVTAGDANLGGAGIAGTFQNSIKVDLDKKPYEAAIEMSTNAGGTGWYFDPTPTDNTEFGGPIATPFYAFSGPHGVDYLSTILHEIGHAVGITEQGNDPVTGLPYAQVALSDKLTTLPAPNDNLKALTLPGGTKITFYNGPNMGHVYDLAVPSGYTNEPYDLMKPSMNPRERYLISDLDAEILQTVYGYTIQPPSSLRSGTFLAQQNSSTGALTVYSDPTPNHKTITLSGNGTSSINVGVDSYSWSFSGVSSVVVNQGFGWAVDINDSGDSYSRTVTISGTGITGLFPGAITYDSYQGGSLEVHGGSGGNTFTVKGFATNTQLILDAGSQGDNVYIGDSTASEGGDEQFTINGNAGTTVTFDDEANKGSPTYEVTSNGVTRQQVEGATSVTCSGVGKLLVHGGNIHNVFAVTDTPAGTQVTLQAGSGTDSITVGDAQNSLGQIGSLNILGGTGTSLALDDEATQYGTAFVAPVSNGTAVTAIGHSPSFDITESKVTYTDHVTLTDEIVTNNKQVIVQDVIDGGTSVATFQYSNILTLTITGTTQQQGVKFDAGATGNVFDIESTSALTTIIKAGNGVESSVNGTIVSSSDTVNIGPPDNLLVNVGVVTVIGGTGTVLNLDDQLNSLPRLSRAIGNPVLATNPQWTLTDTTVTRKDSLTVKNDPLPLPISTTVNYSNIASLVINGGTGSNTFTVESTAANEPITINTGSGPNTVDVTPDTKNLTNLKGNLTVTAPIVGQTIVHVYDPNNPGKPGKVVKDSYTISAGGLSIGDPVLVNLSNVAALILDGAASANYNIQGAPAGTAVTINPGPGPNTFTPAALAQNSGFTVNLAGTQLVLDDSASTANSVYTISGSTVQINGLPPISTSGVQSLTVIGSSGNDIFNVQGTTAGIPLTIQTGAGGDTVNVGSASNTLDPIQGTVSVYGQGANSTLNVYDTGTSSYQQYELFATQITRTPYNPPSPLGNPTQTINYANVGYVNLYGGSGSSDVLGVDSTSPQTTRTALYAAGDHNEFVAEGSSNFGTLDGIQGPLAVHGVGADVFIANDAGNTIGHSYTFTTGQLERDAMANISYDGVIEFGLYAANNQYFGHTPNAVAVQSLGALLAGVVVGAGDTVTVGQNGSMSSIQADFRIQSYLGVPKQITLDDSADTTPRTVTLSGGDPDFDYLISGLLPPSSVGRGRIGLQLDPATPVLIRAGSSGDIFRVTDLTSAPTLSLDGGGGTLDTGTSGLAGDFNRTLSLTNFSAVSLHVLGDWSGSLLASTVGTLAAPIDHITVDGSMLAGSRIKVNYLGPLTIGGNMDGTVDGYGSVTDPKSQFTIGAVTIGSPINPKVLWGADGSITAPSIQSINMQPASTFSGNALETLPGADFQSLVLGTVTSTGVINAGAIANATVAGDMAGQFTVSGAIGTLGVGGSLSGSVTAPYVSSVSIAQDLTGRLTASQALWPSQPASPPNPAFPSGWVPPNPCTVAISGALGPTGVLQAEDLARLSVGKDVAGYTAVAGPIGTFTVGGSVTGSVFAYSIGSTRIQGSLSGVETGLQSLAPPNPSSPPISTIDNFYIGDSVLSIGTLSAPVLNTVAITNTLAGTVIETSSFDMHQLAIGGSLAASGRVFAPRIDTLSVGQSLAGQVTVTGPLNTTTVAGNLTGTISATTIGTVTVGGTLTGQVTASQSVGSVTAAGKSVAQAIFLLDPSASAALDASGNAHVTIPGTLFVDSDSKTAVTASGNSQVTAAGIHVVGGVQQSGSASLSPSPTTGVAAFTDPLSFLSGPGTSGLTNYGSISYNMGAHTLQPGIYSQINASGNASLTLNPGMYVIEGGGVTVTRTASITGNGVTIYNTGSNYPAPGGSYGGITLSGSGGFNLTPATTTAAGAYPGIVIYQSRSNTRALALSGNAGAGLTGMVYAPSAPVVIGGNATLNAALVADRLQVSGTGSSTQVAAGATGDNSASPGTLLAGNLELYVNDSNGYITSDELARIQDAINTWDGLLAPYNVQISEVSDPALAHVVIDTGSTSAAGSAADGILGCYDRSNNEITLLQGWNWYGGSDVTHVGANQYDFQAVVTHELGHALGLGHNPDASSVMYESLAAGVARRTPTAADLNISDPPAGADPERAAPTRAEVLSRVFGGASLGVSPASAQDLGASRLPDGPQFVSTSSAVPAFAGGLPGSELGAGGQAILQFGSNLEPFASLFGQAHHVLQGNGGNDVLIGGDGNDVLIGGNGRDLLIGGFGSSGPDTHDISQALKATTVESTSKHTGEVNDAKSASSGRDWFWSDLQGLDRHQAPGGLSVFELASDLAFMETR